MPRLPDAYCRSVRLNLIDIPTLDPHRLALNDRRLLNDDWLSDHSGLLHHNWLGHDRRRGLNYDRLGVIRTRQCRTDDTADHPADESRPEVPTARPPVPAVVVVVMVSSMPAVMDRRRTMPSSMMPRSAGTRQTRSGAHNRREHNHN